MPRASRPGCRSQSYSETVDQPLTRAQARKPHTSAPAARPPQRRQGPRAATAGAVPAGAPSAGWAMSSRDGQQAVVAGAAADEGRVELQGRAHRAGREAGRCAAGRPPTARLDAAAQGAAVDLPVVEAREREAPALDPRLGESAPRASAPRAPRRRSGAGGRPSGRSSRSGRGSRARSRRAGPRGAGPGQLREGGRVVVEVLEHLGADGGVEGRVGQGQPLRRRRARPGCPPPRRARAAPRAPSRRARGWRRRRSRAGPASTSFRVRVPAPAPAFSTSGPGSAGSSRRRIRASR